MGLEVSRRLISGVWRTRSADDSSGDGGGGDGGSQPNRIDLTFTAAAIAAAFSEADGVAYIAVPEITADLLIAWVGELTAPTLDGDLETYAPSFYTPAAATTDVYNNGNAYDGPFFVIGDWSPDTYKRKVTPSPAAGFVTVDPAAAFYAGWNVSEVPTEGESYLSIGVWRST